MQACRDSGKTTLNITNSFVDSVMAWGKGSCRYDIRNSTMRLLEIGPNSTANVVGTSGNGLDVDDNSMVMLINSSWGQIRSSGDSLVLVKDWFFGLSIPWMFGVPFNWVSLLEFLFVLEALIAIGAPWHFLRKARKQAEMRE